MGGFGLASGSGRGCSTSGLNHQASEASQPSLPETGGLGRAARLARRAGEAQVEMVVMAPHGPDLAEPAAVAGRLPADRRLDGRVDEDPLDFGLFGSGLDQGHVPRRPPAGIDVEPVGSHHVGGRHEFPLLAGEPPRRHGREPDVGVEPHLMRGMARQHGAAARLGDVADQQTRPARDGRHRPGEAFEECDELGVAPVPVPRQAHHLPGLAVDRQGPGASEASLGVEADRAGLEVGRRQRPPEDLLGGQPGIRRVGQRGQGLGIERAPVLRGSRGGRQQPGAGQAEQGRPEPRAPGRGRRSAGPHVFWGSCAPSGPKLSTTLS